MATFSAERPQFFEGQYLGADDLASIVEYLRTTTARQNLGQHSWGIAIGLDLVSQPVTDTAVEYYVQPGVAIDGFGRLIVVTNPTRIEADAFVSIGSGNVDVWIRYDQSEFSATRAGFKACSATDNYARINETFKIVVGNKSGILDRESGITVNDSLLIDAREALISVDPNAGLLCDAAVPHQQLPVNDETAYWLIPLGHVKWSSASSSFLPLVDPVEADALESGVGTKTPDQVYESLMSSRGKRRLIGSVAESVFAADGLIRLRERTTATDPLNGNDAACKQHKLRSADLHVCDGLVKPKELIWLEGNTRITGDARLLDGRLEFRDSKGSDYIERTVEGNLVSAITPALMQRADGNSRQGVDMQVMLGKSDDGINRFVIGNIEFDGSDLCNETVSIENKVVIQDNGFVGIGTTNPESILASPYTVRGLQETVVVNEGTAEETTYDIYRLESYEADDGTGQWQMDLWDTTGADRKSLNFTETDMVDTRLFLQTGGGIGIGTTAPTESLHIHGDDPALFIDINETSGLHKTELKFGSDGDTHAGMYWTKNTNKVFVHHDGTDSLVIDHQKIGLGTSNPSTTLHVATGSDVTLSDSSGYLLLGDINGLNVVMDNNEIQARNNGAVSQLHLQVEGGDFSVHWGDATEFRIRDNGDVGIGTASPTQKLDVRGNIKLGSAGELFAMGGVENLRTIVGRVNASGSIGQGAGFISIDQGAGFTVSKGAAGNYTLNFSPAFSSTPVVVASIYNEDEHIVSIMSVTSSNCHVRSRDMFGSNAGDQQDASFTFIAIGER